MGLIGRASIVPRRKILLGLLTAAAAYCAVMELWFPREDDLAASRPEFVVVLSAGIDDDGEINSTAKARLRRAIEVSRQTGARLVTSIDG